MRESRFISQNRDKWHRYEQGLNSGKLGAEETGNAFVELNEDLAYARTFYKNRAVRVFLNNLLIPVYTRIFKGKRWTWKSFGLFFTEEVPRMNYAAGRYMLVSLFTVLLGFLIGYFATRYDREFAEVILGENYVEVTENNIAKGDPLAIYKSDDAGDMFVRIASNNLRVAAYFFLFGALFCVGAMYLLLSNGIMLGAFTWMFTSRGLTTEYLLTVYQHGTLEILSMVVEGAAGIMLGAGILFPGTLSRVRSMQNAARKSIVMFLVCVPVIILAAFIESYLTRFTEIPNILRSLIIISSLVLMLYYFVIYPHRKFKGRSRIEGTYDHLEPETDLELSPGKILSNNHIVLLGFDFLKRQVHIWLPLALISLFGFYNMAEWAGDHAIENDVKYRHELWMGSFGDDTDAGEFSSAQTTLIFFNIYASSYYFSANNAWIVPLISGLTLALVFAWILLFHRGIMQKASGNHAGTGYVVLTAFFAAGLQVALNYFLGSSWWLSMLLFFPLNVAAAAICVLRGNGILIPEYIRAMALVFTSLGKFMGMVLINGILYFVSMFGFLYLVAILLAISNQFHGIQFFSGGTLNFFVWYNYFIIPVILVLFVFLSTAMAISVYEIHTGDFMREKIKDIRFKQEVYGLETE